jgi:alpha-amylase
MVVLSLCFEVHQPRRINSRFRSGSFRIDDVSKAFNAYFDTKLDKEILDRAYKRCYQPATQIVREAVVEGSSWQRPFKVAYSFSGVFLEQIAESFPEFIEEVKAVVKTGNAELLSQTYYHSLASIYYDDMSEFKEQMRIHRRTIKNLFGYEPKVFENTELIYNNLIAKEVAGAGFSGIITEGSEAMLKGGSPHQVYSAKGVKGLKVLTRDFKLSDDIAFRFSSRDWDEYPLTAEKYAGWVSKIAEPLALVFMDYETFGEHHWPESGIHGFLRALPKALREHPNVVCRTPSEVVDSIPPARELDVYEHGQTLSWADQGRDLAAWLGNDMQKSAFEMTRSLSAPARTLGAEYLRVWRTLQVSDNFYYMYTGTGGPAGVHSYFSGPVGSPTDVYLAFTNIVFNFQSLMIGELVRSDSLANVLLNGWSKQRGFFFYMDEGTPLGLVAKGYKDFYEAVQRVSEVSLEFHLKRGDFEKWFAQVFGDVELAGSIRQLRGRRLKGKALRTALASLMRRRIEQILATFGSRA